MKFACFERTVEALYKFVVPKPRSECSKPEQLVVTFVAGYIGMNYLEHVCEMKNKESVPFLTSFVREKYSKEVLPFYSIWYTHKYLLISS